MSELVLRREDLGTDLAHRVSPEHAHDRPESADEGLEESDADHSLGTGEGTDPGIALTGAPAGFFAG